MLECGLVYSATLLLLLGVMVLGLGVFQYQQIAALAREGSRWAAVHGPTYSSEQGKPAITATDVLNNAVLTHTAVIDTTALTCTLDSNAWSKGQASVTLSYTWTPAAYTTYMPAMTMNSTAILPICY